MMARYDRVLIDPDRDQLGLALREAVESANEKRRQRRVAWPLPGTEQLLADLREAHGYRQWNGGDGPVRSGEGRSVVVLAWWTDRAGRRHYRVVGRHGAFNRPMLQNLLCPLGEPRPPLWFVYPDHVFLMRHGDERLPQAYCACGSYGLPEELGWMGPSCDACYDLGLEGQTPALAWLAPARATLQGEEGRLSFLAHSPDGQVLAAGTARHEVTLWDTTTGLERGKLTGKPDEWLLGVAWIDDGQRLVTADVSGRLRFWSARTGLPTGYEVRTAPAESFAAAPDGERFGRGDRHRLHLFHAHEGRPLRHLDGDLNGIGCLAFSPDGRLVAAGDRHGVVALWDLDTGQPRGRFERPGAVVTSLTFSPHAQTLAIALHPAAGSTARENARIVLWDVADQGVKGTLPGHRGGTRAVAFAPDGRVLASGGEDGLVKLWEVHSGQERIALEWHLDCVGSVAFAPDGLTLATGSFDGTIKLWPRELLRPPARARQRIAP